MKLHRLRKQYTVLPQSYTAIAVAYIFSLVQIFALAETAYAKTVIEPNNFGQAQSFIAELNGAPLISGNWEGRFRPYYLVGEKLLPVINSHEEKIFSDYDFYSPTPLEGGILMSAQKLGLGNFDLVFYDLQKNALQFATDSTEHDEGNYCISPQGLVAFRQDRQQKVARLSQGRLQVLSTTTLPSFSRCVWLDQHRFLGATRQNTPIEIYECYSQNTKWLCEPTSLGSDLKSFVGFYQNEDGESGLIGLSSIDEFRRAYAFNADRSNLKASTKNPPMKGDVLEVVENRVRLGFHSRYRATLTDSPRTTVFKLKKINTKIYGIVATEEKPKTLAILAGDKWKLLQPPNFSSPLSHSPTSEIWLPTMDGFSVQAFYFGQPDAKKIVLWLHGGPRENVSPRFNPYFNELNARGFAVLALNYPGSTGRGRPYELKSRDIIAQHHAVAAAFKFLQKRNSEQIVGWSISDGSKLLYSTLRKRFPYTALVDQAGFRTAATQTLASFLNIPFLSIRGAYDIRRKEAQINFDYVYAGGHDITYLPHFQELFQRFDKMIDNERE